MTTFHRIDFFRAALQVRGASVLEIEETLAGIRKLGGDKFDAWNRPMTEQDQRVLAMMLGPQGRILAVQLLDGFKKEVVTRWGISPEEMNQFIKSRFSGLN